MDFALFYRKAFTSFQLGRKLCRIYAYIN